MYVGRSDNVLGQRFHITPRQLYTLFSQKLEEVQGPPQEEKQVSLTYEPPFNENASDKEIIEALIKHLKEQDGFLTAINCVSTKAILSWLEKQQEQKPVDYEAELKKCKDNPLYFFDKYVSIKQKPWEWGEEETKLLDSIIDDYEAAAKSFCGYDGKIGLLRAIRDGEYDLPKQEWSGEDNICWDEAFACVTRAKKTAKNEEELQSAVIAEKWLKEIQFKYYVHPVKPEWSEEDEHNLNSVINLVHTTTDGAWGSCIGDRIENWLKNLPERFNLQPKPEWGEEDEKMLQSIIKDFRAGKVSTIGQERWLKSLRPQYHGDVTMTEAYKMGVEAGKASSWKPSKEQMDALDKAIPVCMGVVGRDEIMPLESLCEQLKKL